MPGGWGCLPSPVVDCSLCLLPFCVLWPRLPSLPPKYPSTPHQQCTYLPGRKEERKAFACSKLLGKTLAYVHMMEMRNVANVLWAIGKLDINLAGEGVGPHLAVAAEEQIRALVEKGGLKDGRDASQLWYGLEFTKYSWSKELLQLLVDHSCPLFSTWDRKAQGQVLKYVQGLCGKLISDQQRTQLAAAVEEVLATALPDEQELYRSAPPFVRSAPRLGLRFTPGCLEKLHQVLLSTPPMMAMELGTADLAFSLICLRKIRHPISRDEADRWEDMLLTVWRAAPRRGREKLSDFSLLLGALLMVPDYIPSEDLQLQLLDVAVQARTGAVDDKTARRLIEAAGAWSVALPADVAQQLSEQAAGKGRPAAPGGRGGRGGRPPPAGGRRRG